MDHTRDNPLKRFKAFWIALLLVFSFGVALLLLRPLTHRETDSADTMIGQGRLEVKDDIDRAQDAALNAELLDEAMAEQLKTFAQNTPKKGAMPVPAATPEPKEKEAPPSETPPATE